MSEKSGFINNLIVWASAFLIAFAIFYGMNHAIMAMQGLPLNMDLTPVQ